MNSFRFDEAARTSEAAPEAGRILLVEDDRDSAEVLREVLEFEGFEVSVAADGLTAQRQADSVQPANILLDIQLDAKRDGGIELCRQLRSRPDQRWRIYAVTGNLKLERSELISCGFDGVLYKPLDVPSLLEQLGAAVEPAE